MIGFILRIIASPVFRALWRPFAIVLGVLTFGAFKRREGAQAAKAKQAEANVAAVERGVEGAAEAKADLRAGKTAQEVKDGNDAAWR